MVYAFIATNDDKGESCHWSEKRARYADALLSGRGPTPNLGRNFCRKIGGEKVPLPLALGVSHSEVAEARKSRGSHQRLLYRTSQKGVCVIAKLENFPQPQHNH